MKLTHHFRVRDAMDGGYSSYSNMKEYNPDPPEEPRNPLDKMKNKELASFFNKVKIPYLMNGFDHYDFRVTINHIGNNNTGHIDEYNLSINGMSMLVQPALTVLARAVVEHDVHFKETIVSEVVFEHNTEKIFQIRIRVGVDMAKAASAASSVLATVSAVAAQMMSAHTARTQLGIFNKGRLKGCYK